MRRSGSSHKFIDRKLLLQREPCADLDESARSHTNMQKRSCSMCVCMCARTRHSLGSSYHRFSFRIATCKDESQKDQSYRVRGHFSMLETRALPVSLELTSMSRRLPENTAWETSELQGQESTSRMVAAKAPLRPLALMVIPECLA